MMDHHHTGPVDRACPNCYTEVKHVEKMAQANASTRRWKIAFLLLLMAATIGALALFAYFVKANGGRP